MLKYIQRYSLFLMFMLQYERLLERMVHMAMPTIINNETYYSTREAMDYLGISRPTLDSLVDSGTLRRFKQGIRRTIYYRKADLDQILEVREYPNGDSQED